MAVTCREAKVSYTQTQFLISYVSNPVTLSNHRKTDTVLALGWKYGRRCPSLRLGTRLPFHGSQCISPHKRSQLKIALYMFVFFIQKDLKMTSFFI